mmetsp:Transcript_3931/g.4893  ORF Transcript_3931/g.4893 Transcript_3931/m.4893 type:complete len:260 (+) Transcript_3931:407-1186(+)
MVGDAVLLVWLGGMLKEVFVGEAQALLHSHFRLPTQIFPSLGGVQAANMPSITLLSRFGYNDGLLAHNFLSDLNHLLVAGGCFSAQVVDLKVPFLIFLRILLVQTDQSLLGEFESSNNISNIKPSAAALAISIETDGHIKVQPLNQDSRQHVWPTTRTIDGTQAQNDDLHFAPAAEVAGHRFSAYLAAAVRIHRTALRILCQELKRAVAFPVGASGRGNHHLFHSSFVQGSKQHISALDVVLDVLTGVFHGSTVEGSGC